MATTTMVPRSAASALVAPRISLPGTRTFSSWATDTARAWSRDPRRTQRPALAHRKARDLPMAPEPPTIAMISGILIGDFELGLLIRFYFYCYAPKLRRDARKSVMRLLDSEWR